MADALHPGTLVLGYVIERVLGRGGMGTVYLARQLSLNRLVALKVLHPSRVKNPKAADDFFREAAAAAKLNHPGLVGVHDLQMDTQTGIYAFSMEYVPGRTVFELVRDDGPLSRALALTLIAQVAQAMTYAHKSGFIHRDVKPENILVVDGRTAKLLDLGLAYNRLGNLGRGSSSDRQSSMRRLTLVGTPDYSAPEQSRNPSLATYASDVWSLGATLYFMLTGRTPFDGETIIDLIVSAAIDPLEFPDQVTADCRQLIELMMAKQPIDRLADGEEVLSALQQMHRGAPPTLPVRYQAAGGARPVLREVGGETSAARRRVPPRRVPPRRRYR